MVECRVFSTTKSRDRRELGDKVTQYLQRAAGRGLSVKSKVVVQSSDREFHCVSIVLFMRPTGEKRSDAKREKNG